MNNCKKLLALGLAGAMTLSLAACGGGSSSGTSSDGTSSADKVVYRELYSGEVTTLNYLTTSNTKE